MIYSNNSSINKLLIIMAVVFAISGCKKDDFADLDPATFPAIGEVFIDGFSPGLQYDSYDPAEGANPGAFDVVSDITYEGDAAMRFAIPDPDNPEGSFAGGTFSVPGGRDLTEFNALIFWMRASKNAVVDLIGFGDEFEFGDSEYRAFLMNVSVNSNWKQYILPLPDPSVLTQEQGMFWISEGTGNDNDLGYTLWIDEVEFVTLSTLAQYRPAIQNGQDDMVDAETGQNITLTGLQQTVSTEIGDVTVSAAPAYFTFTSSNTSVATVNDAGEAMVLDAGTAVITAKLADMDASGSLTIEGTGEAVLPATPAPVPTRSADSVIALYSNAYEERLVDTWDTDWEFTTTETDFVQVDGDDIIRYRMLNFVGIEFVTETVDISSMTHFHMDIWTPDPTNLPNEFKVLLADFGPNNMFDGGDDSSHELVFTSPLLQTGEWVSIDVPLSAFAGLTGRMNLAQMVLSGNLPNVFVDNVYFYIDGGSTGGGECDPPQDPVLTTSFPVDFENCDDLTGVFEAGDGVTGFPTENPNQTGINTSDKVYQFNKVVGSAWYSGIFHIFPSNFDMTDNKVFKMKMWSPKPNLNVRFQVEKEGSGGTIVTYIKNATLADANTWTELTFDFTDQPFITGTDVYDKIVIIPDDIDAGPSDGSVYYIDDIELTGGSGGGDEPTEAAPAPTHDAANVISVFSDAYTNIGIADFNPGWGQSGSASQVDVAGNNTLKYENLNYQGTQFAMNEDLSEMEFVHIDMWTADATVMKFSPISFTTGEFQVELTPITSGQWVSYDIPVTDFTTVTFGDIHQLIFNGQDGVTPSNIWLDNIYFYKTGGGATEPTVGAPAPTHDAANVISVFSDAYANIGIADFNPGWGQSGSASQVDVAGNNTLKYENLNYQGTQFAMNEDLSEMEFVHIDMWTADATVMKFSPISFTTGEFQVELTPITSGQWVSYDIPVTDFTTVTFGDIHQLIFNGQDGVTPSNIWLDNIYFYKTGPPPTEPTTGAPDPTHDAMDVISVFSDAYTNIGIADFNPGWGQSGSASQVLVAGNNTLKYENLNYQGTQFAMNEDLSEMEFVHIDMWTADATVMKFSPISFTTGEFQVELTPITSGQWVSYDIPVTDFTTVTFGDIHQLIFNGQDGVTPSNIWLDNIYFYKTGGGATCDPPQDPSLTALPIDFENCEDFTGVFEDGDGVTGFPAANPNQTGINTSAQVYQFNKVADAAWYSGIFHIFPSNFDMTTTKVFKMKIWSPQANLNVRFQIEKEGMQGPIVTYQKTAIAVNADTWTELIFDFSDQPFITGTNVYDKIVIIPDDDEFNGNDIGRIYYIDDVSLGN